MRMRRKKRDRPSYTSIVCEVEFEQRKEILGRITSTLFHTLYGYRSIAQERRVQLLYKHLYTLSKPVCDTQGRSVR